MRLPCERRGESTCYAKRSKRKKTARSYAALRRAAYYPLSLPPYCKAFMAFLGFWQTASLRSAIVLLKIGVRRSGVNGPQTRPLKLSFGNPQRERLCSYQKAHYPPVPSQSAEAIPPEPPSGAAFDPIDF